MRTIWAENIINLTIIIAYYYFSHHCPILIFFLYRQQFCKLCCRVCDEIHTYMEKSSFLSGLETKPPISIAVH